MFKNPGKGLKTLAKVIFAVIIIVFIIAAMILIANTKDSSASATILGIVLVAVGVITAWVSSISIYAFGELVENVNDIKTSVNIIKRYTSDEM